MYAVFVLVDPIEQEKAIKYNDLVANCVIFWNTSEVARILVRLKAEGVEVNPADLRFLSPYVTGHIKRFGDYLVDPKRPTGLHRYPAFLIAE